MSDEIKRVKVTFEVDLPVPGATLEDATEWVQYHIGYRASMKMDNLLEPYDIENSECVIVDSI